MELDILCSQYHAIIWRLGAYPPTTFWITINVTSHQHWFLKHACRLRGILLGKSIHKRHRRKISVREITFCSLFPHLKGVSSISKQRAERWASRARAGQSRLSSTGNHELRELLFSKKDYFRLSFNSYWNTLNQKKNTTLTYLWNQNVTAAMAEISFPS